MLTCLVCLRAHMPTCLTCLRANVPACLACLRAHVPTCLAWLRANVPCMVTCSRVLRAYVLTCSRANVPCVSKCLRAKLLIKLLSFSWEIKLYMKSIYDKQECLWKHLLWEFHSTFRHLPYQVEAFNRCYDKLCTIKWFNFCLSRTLNFENYF